MVRNKPEVTRMNHMTATVCAAIDSTKWAYRQNRTKVKALGLVVFVAILAAIGATTPIYPSPLNDGTYCVAVGDGGHMCKMPGDYSPRYFVTPDGYKVVVR
jgi:hypothetical protein